MKIASYNAAAVYFRISHGAEYFLVECVPVRVVIICRRGDTSISRRRNLLFCSDRANTVTSSSWAGLLGKLAALTKINTVFFSR